MLQVSMSGKASFRNSVCALTLWKATSSMLCKIPSYSFASLKISVSVEQTRIVLTSSSSLFHEVSWKNDSYSLPTTGSLVRLSATGFGKFDISARLSLSTLCESSFWRADSSISCKSPQSESKYVSMIASLASRKVFSELIFSQSAPSIRDVQPTSVPSTGLRMLTLSGNGFIFHNLSHAPMRIGFTPVQSALYVSDSSLLILTPPGEGDVNVYFEKNSDALVKLAYSFNSIFNISATLSDRRTGRVVQLQLDFSSTQLIEKFGMIFVYLPNQIQLRNDSSVVWSNETLQSSGEWIVQNNSVRFQSQQEIQPSRFTLFLKNVVLSSTVVALSPIFFRTSMASNITVDIGSLNLNLSTVPSNSTEYQVIYPTLYAGDTINVSVLLKTFNSVEIGDIFLITFPKSGASFALSVFSSNLDLSLMHRSSTILQIKVLTANLMNYSFVISGIDIQPLSGVMSNFAGNHSNNLGILKENFVPTDDVQINPGKMRNISMVFSNTTIGSTTDIAVSFMPANSLSSRSVVIVEFERNDLNFTDQAFVGSLKAPSFFDGNRTMSIQIPSFLVSGSMVDLIFRNAFINFGPSRLTSVKLRSQVFHSAWNSTASYLPVVIDNGTSNSIILLAPNFSISTKFSSLQMNAQIYVNITMHVPNALPSAGSLHIIISDHFNFSQTISSITSNCFDVNSSSALLLWEHAVFTFQSFQSRASQNCFIHFGPVLSPGYP